MSETPPPREPAGTAGGRDDRRGRLARPARGPGRRRADRDGDDTAAADAGDLAVAARAAAARARRSRRLLPHLEGREDARHDDRNDGGGYGRCDDADHDELRRRSRSRCPTSSAPPRRRRRRRCATPVSSVNLVVGPLRPPGRDGVAQNPAAGKQATEGSTVRLNVARRAGEATPQPTTTEPATTDARDDRAARRPARSRRLLRRARARDRPGRRRSGARRRRVGSSAQRA